MYEDQMALFEKIPGAFDLYLQLEHLICARYPQVQVHAKRTQTGFFDGCGFAWASLPLRGKSGITATLGLPAKIDSPRIFAASEPYPGRWTHHIILRSSDDMNDEFIAWLDTAHAFALDRKRK